MNFFISCTLFHPAKLGGPANTLYWLSKGLVASGNCVEVVCTNRHVEDPDIPLDTSFNKSGITVTYCTSIFKLLKKSWSAVKKNDSVLLSSVCDIHELVIAIFSMILRKKVIWSPRGEFTTSAIGGSFLKKTYFTLVKLLVSRHVIFHATSQDEYECIKNVMGEKGSIVIIPNFMEVPELEVRNPLKAPYFLYLGRIAPIKAIDNLLKGLSLSSTFEQSAFTLEIAGGVEDKFKDYYLSLKELIHDLNLENKVRFVGAKYGKDKMQAYCNAHFMFLISKSENFGNVVIESLSQGTPVVASKGTPWEKLPDEKAGFWIDNSPESIAKIVDDIIQLSDVEYNTYRKGALKFSETFDVYKNAEKWVDAFSN